MKPNRIALAIIATPLLAVTPWLWGDDDHDHHDHAPPATKPAMKPVHDDHAGHDHAGHDHAGDNHDAHQHDDAEHDHGAANGHADEVKLTADAVRDSGITITVAETRGLQSTLAATGRVAFNDEAVAHVGSLVEGRITRIDGFVGKAVKRGDVLLTIESVALGEAQSDYARQRVAVEVAQQAVGPAENALDRARKLYEQEAGLALNELQKREADAAAARGTLRSAEATLAAARNKLTLLGVTADAVAKLDAGGPIDPTYVIRAPIDGQVIERDATQGELVSSEKDALLVIADLSRVWVLADVPENQASAIKLRARAFVRTAAAADQVKGRVTFVAPRVDAASRTVSVRVDVDNTAGLLRPGMFARIDLTTGDETRVLAVPDVAVQMIEGRPAVFVPVAGEENTFAARPVKVGPSVGGMTPITEGLVEGDRFVSTGAFVLKADLGKAGAAHEH